MTTRGPLARLSCAALLLLAAPLPTAAAPSAVEQLHRLLDQEWERGLRDSPESASFLGDARYNDRWTDLSPAAIAQREQADRAALERLLKIPRAKLPPAEQVNYDLFRRELELSIDYQPFELEQMPVSPTNWDGFGSATTLAQILRFRSARDYEDWLARLEAYGAHVDQNIALMRLGMQEGRLPSREPLQRIPAQLRAYAPAAPEDSPFYAPFRTMDPSLAPADAGRLRARARAAIAQVVTPAWQRFGAFFEKEYLPKCRAGFAIEELPDGVALYALRVRHQTTTRLTPDEIHDIGLREVARIRAEMEGIMAQVGFRGSLPDFFRFLRSDPRFFYRTGEELFNAYVLIAKRIDPELVKLFGRLPRMPYGLKPIPEGEAPNATTAYYQRPADDGSRAGYFFTNLHKPETRPKWEMEALTVHEAVPGHHLQIALAQELGDLPKFRRLGGYTAFVEGWGLYSESLGPELGLYQDPYSKFGQLTYEMWRAVRLVLDTGLHHKRWTRQQAIDYFKANAAKTENDIAVEVDRYISWPGQALAYKIGELKIKELRARAQQRLGAHFDVRAFHDVVLGNGAVPLDVLEGIVDAWLARQQERARP